MSGTNKSTPMPTTEDNVNVQNNTNITSNARNGRCGANFKWSEVSAVGNEMRGFVGETLELDAVIGLMSEKL